MFFSQGTHVPAMSFPVMSTYLIALDGSDSGWTLMVYFTPLCGGTDSLANLRRNLALMK
jgi:hypothetical protein